LRSNGRIIGSRVAPASPSHSCPCCGGRMIVIETFEFGLRAAFQRTKSGSTHHDRDRIPRRAATPPILAMGYSQEPTAFAR
jgi:hypothetical protein